MAQKFETAVAMHYDGKSYEDHDEAGIDSRGVGIKLIASILKPPKYSKRNIRGLFLSPCLLSLN